MKRLLAILVIGLLACSADAAFNVSTNLKTVVLTNLSDDFTDFRFRWAGYDSQYVKFTIESTTGSGYVMTGYTATFRATKRSSGGTNIIYIAKTTSDCTVSSSNITFECAYTNIPPNGSYNAELLLFDGTSLYRSLARGTIFVRESLYASDGSDFTYPVATTSTTLANLYDVGMTTVATGDMIFRSAASLWENLAIGTSGYVLSSSGTLPQWSAVASLLTADTVTNVVGDTEFVITGSGGHVITGAVGSAIARDTEVAALSNAVDSVYYPRSNPTNFVTAAVTNGLPMATPDNTTYYVRRNATWEDLFVDAADVGVGYVWQDGTWTDGSGLWLPLAGGTMLGALSLGSNQNINLVYTMQLINADPVNPGLGYGAIKWQDGSTYLCGNGLIPAGDAGRIAMGFSGAEKFVFCNTNLNTGTADLLVGGTIYEGGTALANKYAPKGITTNFACLIPGNTTNWLCITNGAVMAVTATAP